MTRPSVFTRGTALAALTAVLAAVGGLLVWRYGGRPVAVLVDGHVLDGVLNGVTLGVLAGVLLARRPDNRLGWLILVIAGANSVSAFGTGYALAGLAASWPAWSAAAWLASWPWAPAMLLGATLVLLLYPSGRTGSVTGHRLAVLSVVAAVALGLAVALLDDVYDGAVDGVALGTNPVSRGLAQGPLEALATAGAGLGVLVALATWVHTGRRLWRARSPEREQLAWLVVATVPTLLVVPTDLPWLSLGVQVLATLALGAGILRHRLFDIKLVLRSGLVYGTLTAFCVAGYVAVVAALSVLTARGVASSLFALATVGLLVVPVHHLLQRWVGRLVYGDRTDPLRAMRRVGEGMRATGVDDLRPMLDGLAVALHSPWVAVREKGVVVAEVGEDPGEHPVHRVALQYAGRHVGDLVVAGRTERDHLGRGDTRLVSVLAGPVAAAVHAAATARELTASRERLRVVRDAERTRLRADLHDGLGPALSGVALGLEAALGAVRDDRGRTAEILSVVHREVDRLVESVRGIIEDLGPEDVDLVGVLGAQVEALVAAGNDVVFTHDPLDVTAPEVTTSAHRIAAEALTNAARHAGARRITVHVGQRSDRLVVEVCDDGAGTAAPRPGGLGLASMRDRASAVGGRLVVDTVPGLGTRVAAELPVSGT